MCIACVQAEREEAAAGAHPPNDDPELLVALSYLSPSRWGMVALLSI